MWVLSVRRKFPYIPIKYILFSELRQHCDALCKFGDSHKIMDKIAKTAG
jgi:type II restriction enzyme